MQVASPTPLPKAEQLSQIAVTAEVEPPQPASATKAESKQIVSVIPLRETEQPPPARASTVRKNERREKIRSQLAMISDPNMVPTSKELCRTYSFTERTIDADLKALGINLPDLRLKLQRKEKQ